MSEQVINSRTEFAERYVNQTLEQIKEQKALIERLKSEGQLSLVEAAQDYLLVLLETLQSALDHVQTVSEKESQAGALEREAAQES